MSQADSAVWHQSEGRTKSYLRTVRAHTKLCKWRGVTVCNVFQSFLDLIGPLTAEGNSHMSSRGVLGDAYTGIHQFVLAFELAQLKWSPVTQCKGIWLSSGNILDSSKCESAHDQRGNNQVEHCLEIPSFLYEFKTLISQLNMSVIAAYLHGICWLYDNNNNNTNNVTNETE